MIGQLVAVRGVRSKASDQFRQRLTRRFPDGMTVGVAHLNVIAHKGGERACHYINALVAHDDHPRFVAVQLHSVRRIVPIQAQAGQHNGAHVTVRFEPVHGRPRRRFQCCRG